MAANIKLALPIILLCYVLLVSCASTSPAQAYIDKGNQLYEAGQFEKAIEEHVQNIMACASQCLQQAQVRENEIDLVILTGGSTEVPVVQAEFRKLFPLAAVADENKLSSVGLGLAYDSHTKFGAK